MSERRLTHVDEQGRAAMVDVSGKDVSERVARARARVRMSPASARAVRDGDGPKGEVLGVARLAGVQAAKQTGQLIPLAHPLALSHADVRASVDVDAGLVELIGEARTVARTGVEMEAMTAAAVAALTVYDMVKGLEKGVVVEEVVLLEKRGGRSGDYVREGAPAEAAPERPEPSQDAGPPRAALLTISTSKAAGEGEDESGPRLSALAQRLGVDVVAREIVPDDRARIEARLRELADRERCRLVLTSGGTGTAPSDVTPEATRAVIEREIPGLGEAMRSFSRPHTPNWMLSRATAGVRGGTLIVNFPGSPASIDQIGEELAPAIAHALGLISGRPGPH